MKILGIDPGTQVAGYGVIEKVGSAVRAVEYGSIKVNKNDVYSQRLKTIHDKIMEIIHKHKPDQMAIEEVFYGKNIKATIKIGEGRGIVLLCAALANIPITEYAATVIKKAVVGNGNAHKDQVQLMVKLILGLSDTPEPQDASDALAIAICHSHNLLPGYEPKKT
ncbi:MAG TPA: crossover junction endodeoxyribonuclease RuvC [Candidatus Brocadiaceae bacterium]|nr:crossover junction endodeoxyribonuclease RuvC [Candidatus Brocadiaceae bacterium]